MPARTGDGQRTVSEMIGSAFASALVTTGGASVGEHDLVIESLKTRGLKLDFWQIAMRPGKPLLFGTLGAVPVLVDHDPSTYNIDVGRIRVGQKASFSVDAFPGRRFEGRVTRVGSSADPLTSAVRLSKVRAKRKGNQLAKARYTTLTVGGESEQPSISAITTFTVTGRLRLLPVARSRAPMALRSSMSASSVNTAPARALAAPSAAAISFRTLPAKSKGDSSFTEAMR